jgi:hypothetical protein
MGHFFVSYTGSDTAWAEWIAWALEDASHKVTLQKWDFRPGANFLAEMQKAAAAADQTIAVLSTDYLKSSFATPEWAAAMSQDPMGAKFKLVPVRVEKFDPAGMWRALIYIDLVGVDEETARKRLIDGLSPDRAKPSRAPLFPGATHTSHAGASFPGGTNNQTGNKASTTYLPRINRMPSDLDQRRFVQTILNNRACTMNGLPPRCHLAKILYSSLIQNQIHGTPKNQT